MEFGIGKKAATVVSAEFVELLHSLPKLELQYRF